MEFEVFYWPYTHKDKRWALDKKGALGALLKSREGFYGKNYRPLFWFETRREANEVRNLLEGKTRKEARALLALLKAAQK